MAIVKKDRRKRERRRNYVSPQIIDFMETQDDINNQIKLALFGNENESGLVKDVKEMHEIFSSVDGFKKISVILLKGLIMIGSAVTAFYVLAEFFKRTSK